MKELPGSDKYLKNRKKIMITYIFVEADYELSDRSAG
jgi:hypothetical protein